MPQCKPISPLLREALMECFRETALLVRFEIRRQLVLIGGAGSVAQNSVLYTEDVDVAGPQAAIHDILMKLLEGTPKFSLEPDSRVSFDSSQGIRIRVDLLEIGDVIEHVYVVEPLFGASVASKTDLLRLRAATVMERGSQGECEDFRWLVSEIARDGNLLPCLNEQERYYMRGAGLLTLGDLDRLVLLGILREEDGHCL